MLSSVFVVDALRVCWNAILAFMRERSILCEDGRKLQMRYASVVVVAVTDCRVQSLRGIRLVGEPAGFSSSETELSDACIRIDPG